MASRVFPPLHNPITTWNWIDASVTSCRVLLSKLTRGLNARICSDSFFHKMASFIWRKEMWSEWVHYFILKMNFGQVKIDYNGDLPACCIKVKMQTHKLLVLLCFPSFLSVSRCLAMLCSFLPFSGFSYLRQAGNFLTKVREVSYGFVLSG